MKGLWCVTCVNVRAHWWGVLQRQGKGLLARSLVAEPDEALFHGRVSFHPFNPLLTLVHQFSSLISLFLFSFVLASLYRRDIFTFYPSFKKSILFIYFEREGKERRMRGRETSMCDCLLHAPYWGPGLKPKHVPWLGIKLMTLWFSGWHSIR